MSASGEQIGAVSDILVDERDGAFDGLEVESHSLGGLRTHRKLLPRDAAPRIGPDAVIVSDLAARRSAETLAPEQLSDTSDEHTSRR